jgi:ABC-2 type transport system permease protein
MTSAVPVPPPLPPPAFAPSPAKTLRRLFLTLFLRGRSSRGLQKQGAPKSIGQKLALTLVFYALFGMFALFFTRQPVFALSVYLHGMTFVFLGMFVASSAGEVLFNKEEADILLHRPVAPRTLLWAKICVLVEVSLWLGGAFNLAGLFVGLAAPDGGWRFPIVHAISTTLEALFCTGFVVMTYQLCLRWFGRERLDGLMTMAQVIVSVTAVLAGQIVPRLVGEFGAKIHFSVDSWWIGLLPPAWFAGFDDALGGHASIGSWLLTALALIATAMVLWIAFGKLAHDYEAGLQRLNETVSAPRRKRAQGRRWIDVLVKLPPLTWWLREPVARASFLLTAAYLVRDRDVKLRVYPGLAPMLVMPFIFLVQEHGRHGGSGSFGVAFSGSYLGLVPMMGLSLLQYSQQWQASDVFRASPMPGPAALCHGARRAVLLFLTLPLLAVSVLLAWLVHGDASQLLLLLPGIIALPVYALVPSLGGKGVPLSLPTEEAKSAGRGLSMIVVLFVSMALAGIVAWSWSSGWFWWLVLGESILVVVLYAVLRVSLTKARWPSME